MPVAITWPAGGIPSGMAPTSVRRVTSPKGPNDLTPVTGDFRGTLATIDCDKLSTGFVPLIQIVRNDGGTVDLYAVGTPLINPDATRVTVWLAAGSIGFEYLVSVTVQSIDGQELTRSFILPVSVR